MRDPRRVTHVAALVGYGLGLLALYWGLRTEIPPSWTTPQGDLRWLGAPMAAFLLPTAVLVIDVLLRGLSRRPVDLHGAASGLAAIDAIVARVAVFVVGVHAAVLAGLLGWVPGGVWVVRVVPLMLGLTMVSVGNLLPRTRPNLALGIRTQRTLSDRACWNRTHRGAGYVTVASGVVVALSALAVPMPIGPRMIQLIGPIALVGMWLLVRRQGRALHA
ncbi:MAG: SdpI family protein [Vicinamibacteraceae bacterium]